MNPKAEFKSRTWLQLKNLLAIQMGVLLLWLTSGQATAQTYKVLHSFTGSDGSCPQSHLVLSGTTLYGTTMCGGITNQDWPGGCGTVFKVNTDGSGYTVLKKFNGNDGAYPAAGLVLSGTTLYGTTDYSSVCGTVFKINTDGSGYTVIRSFSYSDGAYPKADLLLSGTTLYGTTDGGGSSDNGTVFSVNTNGSGYTVLKSFTGSATDGSRPFAGLVLSGTTLYGTTMAGGLTNAFWSSGMGTVFKVNTDGSGYAVLKLFSGDNDGAGPYAPLALSGTTLYGTTRCGSASNGPTPYGGTVFKLNTDGSGYTMLMMFPHDQPVAGLVLSGTTLYGAAETGGASWCGTVFQINTDGSGYTVLKSFTGSDGNYPSAELVLSGTTLYGTAFGGGGYPNYGVVFSLSIAPPTLLAPPPSQTAEVGSTVNFKPHIAGDPVLTYEWFFNGTNCISCSQNCNLELTNVQFSQSGSYTVAVTNLFGAVTNSSATLNVIAPVVRRPVPGVKVMGQTGSLLNVDYANSLNPALNWTTLGSVSLTSTSQYYFDVTLPLPTARFYRAWQLGTPSVVPSLNLHYFVPAITLTGNAGDSLRLDYINQFGPTNAWVTLGAITLTNTSQLYFDVSAIGQPPRLYRIVPAP